MSQLLPKGNFFGNEASGKNQDESLESPSKTAEYIQSGCSLKFD